MKIFLSKRLPLIHFRRFGNKSYSAFNSLNKCVKIGVLCASYSLLTSPERCLAQIDTSQVKQIELNEVEVSADAAPDVFAPAGRTITQVRKTEIGQAAIQSLTDMLEFIPNVDLRQRGPYGAQADVSIRGSSFDQTLVLLNGINITDPHTGHYSLNLPVDLESVEKIEVLEGPAARIFGTNALGGAVNFITGTQNEDYVKASLAGGEHGFYKASLAANKNTRHTTHHLAVSHTASDGYMVNTDFTNLSVFTQNKWNNAVVPLDLQLGYTQKDFGANSFYGPKYPDQYESLHTFFAALKGEVRTGRLSITPSAYWRRNYDHYILNRNNPEAYQNFHRTDVYGVDVTVSMASRIGRTSIGALTRSEQILSTNLGKSAERHEVPRQDDKWYTKADQRTNISAFAEQNLYVGKWSASVGVLANYNNYAGRLNLYPGIDVAFRPNELLKIYASANRAVRIPTFTDLYYESPVHVSNPDLNPERSTEYELGTKITARGWNMSIGYFYRNISDAIDWIWLDDQKWHTMNHTELHTHGISAGGQWDVKHSAGEKFVVQALTAHYTLMNSDKASDEYQSNYVMDYLRHKLNFGLTHRIAEKVCAHWTVGWQDRNGTYMQYHAEDGKESVAPYDPFWQIDLKIYRQTERLNIFVEASNLGNVKHQDIGNIILPGRWIRAGVAITISK